MPGRHGAIAARIYRPDVPTGQSVVVFPGVHGGGLDEPRITALSSRLASSGLTVLTAQNDFPMPFLVTAEAAAARILAGLERQRFEIAFPRRFVLIIKLARLLPYGLYFALVRRYLTKNK